jgi:NAD-dependent dihydropyrimidine dehydrogenase PreA subunit
VSQALSIILCRDRAQRTDEGDLVAALTAAVRLRPGCDVTVLPHLVDLAPDGPAMRLLRSCTGPMIVLAWLYPRAAFWVLDANGVRGRMGQAVPMTAGVTGGTGEQEKGWRGEGEKGGDSSEKTALPIASSPLLPFSPSSRHPSPVTRHLPPSGIPDRTIWCLDLRQHAEPEPYLAEIDRIAAGGSGKGDRHLLCEAPSGPSRQKVPVSFSVPGVSPVPADSTGKMPVPPGRGEARIVDEATRQRWYPVIDRHCCTNCLECLNFCLFGVYSLDEGDAILVEQPDACRNGCPACSRICPEGAILFPQHKDPGIAGDPQAARKGLKPDLAKLFAGLQPGQLAALERDRALAQPSDDLDRLVDGMDELEL